VVLFVGLVGGLAMASMAAARRTQSAYPAYLAASRASNLVFESYQPQDYAADYNLSRALEHLRGVASVAASPNIYVTPIGPNGFALPSAINDDDVSFVGSTGAEYFSQDKVVLEAGTMPDPSKADEIAATADAARLLGWKLGETIPFGAFTLAQMENESLDPLRTRPNLDFRVKLVGLVVFSNQVVSDDIDRFPTNVLATPALTRYLQEASALPVYGLRLREGAAGVPAVEREIIAALPRGSVYLFRVTSIIEGEVERATRPETIALGTFGAIAGVVALLVTALMISRRLWFDAEEGAIMWALGARRFTLVATATLGLLVAIVSGALLAAAVAVAMSPLAPLGAVRAVDPSPGFTVDWLVIGAGFAALVTVLSAMTFVFAYLRAPGRRVINPASIESRSSSIAKSAAAAGFSVPAVTGLRFALERGHGRSAAPVRSALAGAVLAVVVVAATVTFGAGLATLVSHPSLYGWNWNYAISSAQNSDIPPGAIRLLSQEKAVAAWSGYGFANIQIDGLTVPAMIRTAHTAVGPPILQGHGVDTARQIVLGAETLALLHKKVGDSVYVSYGTAKDFPVYVPRTRLVVVGSATMPAIGNSGSLHPSMGTGAVIAKAIESLSLQKALENPDPNLNGPSIVLVRLRPHDAGLATLQKVALDADRIMAADPEGVGDTYTVLGPQRPAEIVNYQYSGNTPALLAVGLAAGAIAALGLTLAASVSRRRRDLAILKTLGLTSRQLAVTISWQASVSAVIGIVIGLPIGIGLGRWLWDLFARDIYAVPRPTVPAADLVLVAVLAFVLANAVAAWPGRMAASTPISVALRSE
jgi:hypothetical protein